MSFFGLPLSSVFSSKAPEAPGTRHLSFVAPTLGEEGGGKVIEMHSISCLFPGAPWSVEELRLQDYKALNLWKEAPPGLPGGKVDIYISLSTE